jgi:heme/copper-type cytochrome/quinol oxidase subunit 3
MPILRLAYITLFLIALFTVFTLWSQVGGQDHLDLIPWHIKLVLSASASFAITRAAAAAVSGERGWNLQSVRWLGLALAALFLCGMASLYAHNNLEDQGDEEEGTDATISSYFHRL